MSEQGLQVEVDESGGAAVARLTGELDITSAGALQEQLSGLVEKGDVRVDMSAVEFVDSSGLGALVQLHNLASERNTTLELHSVPERVQRLLEITKLTELFTIV